MTGITAVHNDLPPKKTSRISKRKIAEQCCKFLFPLLFLFVYCLIMAGIFYAIEKDCKSVYHCPVTTLNVKHIALVPPTTLAPTTSESSTTQSVPPNSIPSNVTQGPLPESTTTLYNVSKTISDQAPWAELSYMVSFHFVLISVLTIGYGDIYPCSVGGQILTILFTIIGIPITLMALTRTATLFSKGLHRVWLFTYMKRKKPPYTKKQKRYIDDEVYVPLLWGVLITVIWILLSAEYFYLTLFDDFNPDPDTPPFTYFLAFYFTMITYLTIGFGDYAPIKYNLIFVTMIFFLIGLSLVTMCIDLAQIEFEMFFTDIIDMIEDQYNITLDNDEEQMNVDKKAGIKELIDKKASLSTKVMTKFMGKEKKRELAQVYEEKAKFVSMHAQTGDVRMDDHQVQADIEAKEDIREDVSCQCDIEVSEAIIPKDIKQQSNIESPVKQNEKKKKLFKIF